MIYKDFSVKSWLAIIFEFLAAPVLITGGIFSLIFSQRLNIETKDWMLEQAMIEQNTFDFFQIQESFKSDSLMILGIGIAGMILLAAGCITIGIFLLKKNKIVVLVHKALGALTGAISFLIFVLLLVTNLMDPSVGDEGIAMVITSGVFSACIITSTVLTFVSKDFESAKIFKIKK